MALTAAPKIEICCSFWESFSFTPKTPSDLTICITRMAERIYILSYIKDHTLQNDYRVTNVFDRWIIEEIVCSPTSFIHDRVIQEVRNTQTILDQGYLSLTPVRSGVKMAECMAICGLLFIAIFTGHQIYHQKYSWRVVSLIPFSILLVASLIFSRNTFRRANAMWNSAKLITVVEHARNNKSSIEDGSLLHNPSKYK